jgi:transposase
MRGDERGSEGLFSYIRLEERIASDHPLRAIRVLVNEVLGQLSGRFDDLYSHTGRPSIAPEYLLRATLLQAFFTVRSERQLMEQVDYNLLFRWFVGLSMDDAVWDASTFSKNRDRLLEADVAREFLATLLALPQVKGLLSSDHFSVDGTLIKAWASMKSFGRRMAPASRPRADATASATSGARSARTKPMPRPPIPTQSSIARATVRRAGCATWGT